MKKDGGEAHAAGSKAEGRIYRVHGRVQGVGFRWWTRGVATRLGVAGGVRNLPDGSVEVTARGPGGALERFRAALHRGPPMARVERVDMLACALPDDLVDFTIEH